MPPKPRGGGGPLSSCRERTKHKRALLEQRKTARASLQRRPGRAPLTKRGRPGGARVPLSGCREPRPPLADQPPSAAQKQRPAGRESRGGLDAPPRAAQMSILKRPVSPARHPASSTSEASGGAPSVKSVKLRTHSETQDHLYAASTGHTKWLQISMQKAENPTQADINGFSALHTAALHGRLDCLKMLIEKYAVDVDLSSLTGWRPIHLVMNKENGHWALECLKYLISKSADVNVQNQSGVSPLHKAASEGNHNCLKALLEAGADVHARDIEGQEPIDICRMWGHRTCAKVLANATWKRDKENAAREILKLNRIKMKCQVTEKDFLTKEQMELDFSNTAAFSQWLEKKHLPPPSSRILGFLKNRGESVILRRKKKSMVGPTPSPLTVLLGERGLPGMNVKRDQRQRPWNISTKVSSSPVTCIFRPDSVRIGTDPDTFLDHDFTSFLFLYKNAYGVPVLQVDNIGRISPVPNLPYDVIEKSLYPATRATRLAVPQDLKARHIFDLQRKRPPNPDTWWTDQMAMSLRQTLDPTFIATVKTHLATYGGPEVLSPKPELDCASRKGPSSQSGCSSCLN